MQIVTVLRAPQDANVREILETNTKSNPKRLAQERVFSTIESVNDCGAFKNSLRTDDIIAKLQLNSQLHLHFNPTQSPLQVNSTPPRVELELCPIFGFHHHHHHPPTHQYSFLAQ